MKFSGVVLILTLVLSYSGFAQLGVTPNILEATVYPGGTQRISVSVTNDTDTSQRVTLSRFALEMASGGMPIAVEDAPRSAKDWLELAPVEFVVAPKSSQAVNGTVKAPRDTAGGYYAMLAFNAVPDSVAEDAADGEGIRAGVRFRYRTMVAVLITVPGPAMEAIIQAGAPGMAAQEGAGGFSIEIPLRNNGNMHARIHGSATIESEGGQQIEVLELSAGTGFLLPEQIRYYTTRGTVNLPDGVYVTRLQFDLEKTNRPMKNFFPFYVRDGVPYLSEITDELRAELSEGSAGFTVTPAYLEVSLRPGAQRSEAITLTNITAEPITVVPKIAEWFRTPEYMDLVAFELPPHGRSGRAALSVMQPEIVLPARGHRRVTVRVTAPAQAEGEVYAGVTFDRTTGQGGDSPRARTHRSSLVRVKAEGTVAPSAAISSFTAALNDRGAFDFLTEFKNTGNVGFSPQASISIYDANNAFVERLRGAEAPPFVQAGGEGRLRQEYDKLLDPGAYVATLELRFDPDKPPVAARANFNVEPR